MMKVKDLLEEISQLDPETVVTDFSTAGPLEELVILLADGRRVCECGTAYLKGDEGRSSCVDGCDSYQRAALDEIHSRCLKYVREGLRNG